MGLFGSFLSKFSRAKASIEDLDEFRRVLIESDLGVNVADQIIETVKREKAENLESAVTETLKSFLSTQDRTISISSGKLTTILIVGVNGTGKTTSAAKLAHHFKANGKKVLLVAADTFRAAAVEQLLTWGKRIGVEVVQGAENADPAAVCFDGATRALKDGYEILIIDTAGRLHTKSNLMDELGKVRRVVEKVTPIDEVLFVLDGTTGQNGISQAQVFSESVPLTGMIVTKIDGSTRGGVAIATEKALAVPLKFVGTGEGIEDFRPFDPESYIRELLT
ncbi:MAG: signal recognition particle-docking protein FtsY [Actinobacteria bacterium]|jgi:fused signal recognition particle receptor|nr:signal recognition particle-docking protein FtsY [Actinomycetota bacterium]NCU89365.1 signal recognition particle-docking protein FtsY [Actinomycetota bacterium]NDE53196.1 signal recognition particle-docking protein FtsY [Actinomycetota bacterium]